VVESPDEASLDDVRIISINIADSEGNGILFDVVVAAEIEFAETERRNRETDGKLVRMDASQAPPIGTRGTVIGVDDIGSIMVNWDSGGSLNVACGEDLCRKINE
jgi:hypothetical protein